LPKACPSCRTRYPADALFCAFDGSPLVTSAATIAVLAATDPYIGHEIVGAIEIRQLVGIGTTGRVYRGFQKGIDRDVAVKILYRELSANPALVARFHGEAKVASRLAHPNVVHVLLTGQLPDGAMYIVMEYLDGMSLQSALAASGGAVIVPRAVHIALGLCDAAGEAHAQGIVHRDLKPENVMLVKRGDDPDFVKVLDFGIARLNWAEPSTRSAAGLIFGTARYISPEGAQGERVGPAGDVYSIATMLYQMLAGRTPFDAEQAIALLVQQIHDPPPPLKSNASAAHVPDPIAAVVMKNLAKKAEDRAADARDLGHALLDAAVASGLSAQDLLARPRVGSATRGGLHAGERAGGRTGAPVARTVYDAPPSDGRPGAAVESRAIVRTEIAELKGPGDRASRVGASTSSVDVTMDEQRQPEPTPRPSTGAPAQTFAGGNTPSAVYTASGATGLRDPPLRRALPLLVVVCFLVGAVGMAVVASRVGLLGGRRDRGPLLDTVVSRANDALLHQRWDSPKGDNVRDVTQDGLARWPNEPQLLRIRTLASGDILKAARAKRDEGNAAEALRLAKLAYQLDPSDDLAQKLAAETEAQAQAPPTDVVPPLTSGKPAAGSMAGPTSPKATVDPSNARRGAQAKVPPPSMPSGEPPPAPTSSAKWL
jgi:eukaryotic-like serine/threonine-protein kinase